ncbi:hypothetical protein ACFOPX_08025 [Helicobacter baculiformis]|uniref:SIMPL domain-containing protein n=1 Tax=Helicobacter baculiformis TaxID=427351 RepID=A0ABV7ZME4_9HELI|nr:hypothetical protein [Helicobacter baculiformis]
MRYVKLIVAVVFALGIFVGGLAFERFVLGKHALRTETSQISLELKERQQVTPKAYSTHLLFSSSNALLSAQSLTTEQEESIRNAFKQINLLARESKLCQEASYSLRPNYSFADHKQTLLGHKLYANMACEFDVAKVDAYEKLRDQIAKIATENTFFVLNTPALQLQASAQDRLNLQTTLLDKAQKERDLFAKALNKQCRIKDLSFYASEDNFARFATARESAPRHMQLSLNARLTLRCF